MFDAIVPTYDLLNRIISLGMDIRWRRRAMDICLRDGPKRLIDLGTGTGDLALMIHERTSADVKVLGVDFSTPMLAQARERSRRSGASIHLAAADAMDLPVPSGSTDGVITAFVMRNIPDLKGALRSIARVLVPEGRLVVLEMTPVGSGPLARLFRFYFNSAVPLIGRLVSGHPRAYAYLPHSVEKFPRADDLSKMMVECGFENVEYSKLAMGSVAIHTGTTPR